MMAETISQSRQTLERSVAAVSSSATYIANALGGILHTPLLPIFTAFNSPERMSVYTCEIETRSTSATSSGVMNRSVLLIKTPSPTSHLLLRVIERTVTPRGNPRKGAE
jgi:hypothetical protein